MSNITLTDNEVRAMSLTLNYDDRESQLSDNFSNAGVEELADHFNWNKHQVAGLIGSLQKKGVAFYDEEDIDLLWLTEEGVNTLFDLIEAEKEQAA
jgi:DNA-binding MarR family transcriptional regulator